MFIVSMNYIRPQAEIEAILSEHMDYVKRYYREGIFLMSGRKNPRTGGVILMNADSYEQVEQIIAEDPLHQAKLVEYDIIEFLPTTTAEDLAQYRVTI